LGALPGRTRGANEMINHEDCDCMLQLENEGSIAGESGGDLWRMVKVEGIISI
jgi:hypothetical protein